MVTDDCSTVCHYCGNVHYLAVDGPGEEASKWRRAVLPAAAREGQLPLTGLNLADRGGPLGGRFGRYFECDMCGKRGKPGLDVLICDECQDLTAAQADTFLKQPNYGAAHLAEVPSSRTACRVAVRMHLVERSRSHFPSGLRQGVVQNFEKAAALYQLAHQIGKYSSIMQKLGDQSANDVKVGPSSPTQARCGEWITIEASGDLALGSRIVAAGHSGSQERHGATSARASRR